MIKIKTQEEFDNFKKLFKNYNPSAGTNKVEFEGRQYIMYAGSSYDISAHRRTFIEDYFHKGYYIISQGVTQIYKTLNVALEDFGGDYLQAAMLASEIVFSQDDEAVSKLNKVFFSHGRLLISTILTDEQLVSKGFAKGRINSDTWFFNTEIEYIDGHMPYRKFNNIYKAIDITQRRKELESMGDSSIQIDTEIKHLQEQNFKFGTASPTFTGLEGITNTFGLELESISGRLEVGEELNLNLRTVHDGSLRINGAEPQGAEYVTGVLTGDTGLAQTYEICRTLSKRCQLNHQCGLHVHVGNLNWTKEDVVFSYILAEMLEEQIFAMLPKSRRNNEYCRKLTPLLLNSRRHELVNAKSKSEYNILIEDMYNDVLMEATYSINDKKDKSKFLNSRSHNRQQQHPQGAKCGYNKGYQRYCWLNFITLLYNTKGGRNSHTLEFRNHSGTFNYTKVVNWLKICLAFCKFVESSKNLILKDKVSLETVLTTVYPKRGTELVKYVKERQEVFKTHGESIDYKAEEHLQKSLKEVVCA